MGFFDLFRRAEPIADRKAFMDFLDTQLLFWRKRECLNILARAERATMFLAARLGRDPDRC